MRALPAIIAITGFLLSACALDAVRRAEGLAGIKLAPQTRLKLAPGLVYLPPAQALQLMQRLGERPAPRCSARC